MTVLRGDGSTDDAYILIEGEWVPISFGGAPYVPLPSTTVDRLWVGGVTSDAAVVTARLADGATQAALRVWPTDDVGAAVMWPIEAADAYSLVTFEVTGLDPDTEYLYSLDDGDPNAQGTFRSFPTEGTPADGVFIHGSCQRAADSPVWAAMLARNPSILFHGGDGHYLDLAVDNVAAYVNGIFDVMHVGAGFRDLARQIPIDYTWDDHDALGDAGFTDTTGKAALRDAYRRAVPHYNLPAASAGGIWHATTFGRIRCVVTDCITERTDWRINPRPPGHQMLGAEQVAWLKAEWLAAKAAGLAICWVTTKSWVHPWGADGWKQYATEQQELADFIIANDLADRMFILTGDMHQICMDDGTNSLAGVPEFMASPFDHFANHSAGADAFYSEVGGFAGGYPVGDFTNYVITYGLTEFTDDGTDIEVTWSAFYKGPSAEPTADQLIATHTFTITP